MRRTSAVAKVVRRLSVYRPAARLFGAGYAAAAAVMAKSLSALSGVDGVYLLGSLTRPRLLQPGKSDVDLIVAARLPTLDSEMRLRAEIIRAHRRWHGLVPVFANLDYFDIDDLGFLRRFANAWALDLDVRWRSIAGVDRLSSPPERPEIERRIELAAMAQKRWMKASTRLLSASSTEDPTMLRGIAERLLMDMVAAYLDVDRLTPFGDLVEAASTLVASKNVADVFQSGTHDPDRLAAAALDVLEATLHRVTADWDSPWQVADALPLVPVTPALEAVAKTFLDEGFAALAVARRGPEPHDAVAFAIAPEEWTGVEALSRARSAHRRTSPTSGWLPRPVLLTAPLFRAAALLAPAPFLGAELATRPAFVRGRMLAAPPAPPPPAMQALLRTRTVMSFIRRHVRARWVPSSVRAYFDYDVSVLSPALARSLDEGRVSLSWARSPRSSERELVVSQREFVAERRRLLERAR